MQRTRHCLSLAAVAVLTCGLGDNIPLDSAYAENSLSTAARITAVYRVELAGFNLGDFKLTTTFRGDKVLDRPDGTAVAGPGAGQAVAGYRIHHGRVVPGPGAEPWLAAAGGEALGWRAGVFLSARWAATAAGWRRVTTRTWSSSIRRRSRITRPT